MSDVSQGPGWWQAADGKWYAPQHPAPTVGTSSDTKGFVKSLYDFKFDHFVTPKVIRFFYGFFVVLLSIGAVIFLLASLASGSSNSAVFGLIIVPVFYFVYLIFLRMYFELVSALFRIADDLRAIRRGKGY